MEFDFRSKVVLVTGGARGIGLGICKMYLSNGARVISTYNKSFNEAKELLNWSNQRGYHLRIFKLDLREIKGVYDFICELRYYNINSIDILINNAAIDYIAPLIFQEDKEIISIINVNFSNTVILTKNILKDFMKEGSTVINISSIWGNVGSSCEAIYSSTKGAINLFTKSLAKEMEFRKIKVIGIAPGIINTDMNNQLNENERNEIIKSIPLNRIGNVEDVVNSVKFFSSNYTNITGQIINVDGGWDGI